MKLYLTCILFVLSGYIIISADAHGSMITPRPRSAHNQVLDSRNKCGCMDRPGGCYSNETAAPGVYFQKGEYCGAGCIGEACLYYQIGCFQGCGTCSYEGKTLYPKPSDLTKAGCDTPPAPTLGGGDAAAEHALRTYNIDGASVFGDWTKWNPWRSPGSSGKGNSAFQPCGVNSGANTAFPLPPAKGQASFANGTDLPETPKSERMVWKSGDVVEAEWAIYANHGGGYSYRLCKKVEGQTETEECYQRTPLDFATTTTEIRYKDGSRRPFLINATTTSVGTWPKGSQWRKNPIPMCNCDIGTVNCAAKQDDKERQLWLERSMTHVAEGQVEAHKGKKCTEVPEYLCGNTTGTNTCLKCGKASAYDCEDCCPGLQKISKMGYSWCQHGKPKPAGECSKENPRACYVMPYPKTYLKPGQQNGFCKSGLMFPSAWLDGTNQEIGRFEFSMVDKLQLPKLTAGEYSLSWRWDCEQTPQVWNSCADVTIEA